MRVWVIFVFLGVLGLTLGCAQNCATCKGEKCDKCHYGYGLDKGNCTRCALEGCKYCDNNIGSCQVCAVYHFREESKEKRGMFLCKNCGFGCVECEDEEVCMKCGKMFQISHRNQYRCVANHKTLAYLMTTIMIFLVITISMGFYCTSVDRGKQKERAIIRFLRKNKKGIDDLKIKDEDEDDKGKPGEGNHQSPLEVEVHGVRARKAH